MRLKGCSWLCALTSLGLHLCSPRKWNSVVSRSFNHTLMVHRTKDAKLIFIKDMSDEHLMNFIKMLTNNYHTVDVDHVDNYLNEMVKRDLCTPQEYIDIRHEILNNENGEIVYELDPHLWSND